MKRMLLMLVLAAAPFGTGCSSPYINVPSLTGDVASNDANNSVALSMEIAALKHVIRNRPPQGAYAISLPRGTSAASYARVVSQLPKGVERHGEQNRPMPIYKVTRVHGRTTYGEVDVIAPRPGGGEDLVNAYMALDIEGWYVQRSRIWRVPVDRALNHLPPEPGENLPKAPAPGDEAEAQAASETEAADERATEAAPALHADDSAQE